MDARTEFSALVADIRTGPDTFAVKRREQLRTLRRRIATYGRQWPGPAADLLAALLPYFFSRGERTRQDLLTLLRRITIRAEGPAWLRLQALVMLAALTHADPAVPPHVNFAFRRRALGLAPHAPDSARNRVVILNNWYYALIELGRIRDALGRDGALDAAFRAIPVAARRQSWFREARARFCANSAKLHLQRTDNSRARPRSQRVRADRLFGEALRLEGADTNRRLNILTDWAASVLRYDGDAKAARDLLGRAGRVLDAAATNMNRAFYHQVNGELHRDLARQARTRHFTMAIDELRTAREELQESIALYRASGHQGVEEAKQLLAEVEVALTEYEVISPNLAESLPLFRKAYPDPAKVVFVMMRFAGTRGHRRIFAAIKKVLAKRGLKAVRADGRAFHQELLANVQTYINGSGTGIAVFERIERDEFNPNVALEVGYMLALRKPVCLLKERTLKHLHADLLGRLYKEFDVEDAERTIERAMKSWLGDPSFRIAS